jgi:hypothetical protein
MSMRDPVTEPLRISGNVAYDMITHETLVITQPNGSAQVFSNARVEILPGACLRVHRSRWFAPDSQPFEITFNPRQWSTFGSMGVTP